MRFSNLLFLQLLAVCSITAASAQDSSYSRVETRSSSTSSSTTTSTGSSDKTGKTDGSQTETGTFADKKVFVPKFKERIKNLKEQVDFSLGKGFITQAESTAFHARLDQLHVQEEDLAKKGYPKAELDGLEKGITGLNSDLFKASNKASAEKAGTTTTGSGTAAAKTPAPAAKTTTTTTTTKATDAAKKPAATATKSTAKTTVKTTATTKKK